MDYPTWYERISRPFRSLQAARALQLADRALVATFAAAYLAALGALAASGDARLTRAIAVPACLFAAVSALRRAIGRKRPYEAHDIRPLVPKDTRGKSLPSRHMASAVVITCLIGWAWPALGAPALLGCVGVGFVRIVGGVHYPSDIAAAVALGLAFGFVGFALLP